METAFKEFFDERKTAWLKQRVKASMSDEEKAEKERECEEKFALENWLPDAAKRAGQLTMATHPCKFSHPSAKTSAIIAISENKPDGFLRTGNAVAGPDIFGNAAALDVHKFLSLADEKGIEILKHIERGAKEIKTILSINSMTFEELQSGFLAIKKNEGNQTTSERVKQVYFPADGNYHLLSILTPSGLMYEMRDRINDLRFSDQTKEARELRRKNQYSETGFDDLLNLTMIGYGGTKPQNISVLNNKNGGKAYLLPSVPPTLRKEHVRLPRQNFFEKFLRWRQFSFLFTSLQKLLASGYNNINIRDARDSLIGSIVDRLIDQVWTIRQQEPGWSNGEKYQSLPVSQKIWLDSLYEEDREEGDVWLDTIVSEISRWVSRSYNKTIKTSEKKLRDTELIHIRSLIDQHREALR